MDARANLFVNIGCGATPTAGWLNFDNSPTLLLARFPGVASCLARLRLLGAEQLVFVKAANVGGVQRADCTALPLATGSVSVVYSSHMLEHLDRSEADRFLNEAHRVLQPGGIIRIVVPDLRKRIEAYTANNDADALMESLLVCPQKPRGLLSRFKSVLASGRHHFWMYDALSLKRLLEQHGFTGIVELPPGKTAIRNRGDLNLSERANESLYMEAVRRLN